MQLIDKELEFQKIVKTQIVSEHNMYMLNVPKSSSTTYLSFVFVQICYFDYWGTSGQAECGTTPPPTTHTPEYLDLLNSHTCSRATELCLEPHPHP